VVSNQSYKIQIILFGYY